MSNASMLELEDILILLQPDPPLTFFLDPVQLPLRLAQQRDYPLAYPLQAGWHH